MQIPEKYKSTIEDITEFLKAIHEERNNPNLVNFLIEKVEELIQTIEEEEIAEKLKILKRKVLLLEKNLEICSDEFLEESLYLLSYVKSNKSMKSMKS